MPKVKTSRIKYPEGWELIEPTFRELEGKMREAENDPHDGKRKCEALWPIFKIAHQKSRYVYDLYYRRKEISKDLYEFCLDQGYADSNLIAKWKKVLLKANSCVRLCPLLFLMVLWISGSAQPKQNMEYTNDSWLDGMDAPLTD